MIAKLVATLIGASLHRSFVHTVVDATEDRLHPRT
jgi:hypothetical protein